MATSKKPIAKKTAAKAPAPKRRFGRPVRLDLSEADHARVQAAAERVGLGKAAYARQAVLERVRADEQRAG